MTKQEILDKFNDIDFVYNDSSKHETLSRMLDELLKEQEAVKPKYNAKTNWFECGACHFSMTSGMHCKGELIPAYKVGFCAKCGRGVAWK